MFTKVRRTAQTVLDSNPVFLLGSPALKQTCPGDLLMYMMHFCSCQWSWTELQLCNLAPNMLCSNWFSVQGMITSMRY